MKLNIKPQVQPEENGFTLLEVLVVVLLVGILATSAAISWDKFVTLQELRKAENLFYNALQEAKANAVRDSVNWQVSFREKDDISQWAVHPTDRYPVAADWQNLNTRVRIIDTDINPKDLNYTTFYYNKKTGEYRMQFNHHGNANGQLGKITVGVRRGGGAVRCVIVSTLIGATRTAQDGKCK
ncbi:MAG TPA: prepilin-type N-terminal cleavage/methylation domain-containing protein [Oscillatoriaceae cyanobacterium M33_DOE_052]|uniref:Prepilin-type N-terminal cleavage/methylation domain-containing protein n=1 Tax=Planktothricoides sp. SpSt-374 TaxID=2282167 RepID=A0A7C3ZMS9_9CYAN|nr:prepilin-type N-terminal cleavage/methylation domain-containing protein [Oscillatoriaceae cyanobacterium M33_DOE_052]